MELLDLNKNEDREIELAEGEEKIFIWRLFVPEKFLANISFLLKEGAKLKNIFLFSAGGKDNYGINMRVVHAGRHSFSDTFIRGIARKKSQVRILGDARADAGVKHAGIWLDGRALLFEDANCRIDPRLEILTSEVERAGHAAAVSKISEDDIFYMATRGVDRSGAEKLKSRGFLLAPLLEAGLESAEAEAIIEPMLNGA